MGNFFHFRHGSRLKTSTKNSVWPLAGADQVEKLKKRARPHGARSNGASINKPTFSYLDRGLDTDC